MDAMDTGVAPPVVTEERWAISVEEAAKRLSVGRTHLYRMVRRGDIPSIQVGYRKVIAMTTINDLLASGKHTTEDN